MALQTGLGAVAVLVEMARRPGVDPTRLADELAGNGLVISLATWLTSVGCASLLALLIRLRPGATIAGYLGLGPVARRTLLQVALLAVVYAVLYDGLVTVLGRPLVPPVVLEAYRTAGWPPLLWSAVVLAAPAFEEALFRGFLLEGWRRSRLGAGGAVALTALLWASIHLQYGLYEIAAIVVLGVLLGAVRVRTGSLWACIAAHGLVNLLATLEAALQLRGCG